MLYAVLSVAAAAAAAADDDDDAFCLCLTVIYITELVINISSVISECRLCCKVLLSIYICCCFCHLQSSDCSLCISCVREVKKVIHASPLYPLSSSGT